MFSHKLKINIFHFADRPLEINSQLLMVENNYSGLSLPELLDLLSKKTEQYNKYLLSGVSPGEKKKIKEELRNIQEEIKKRDHE